MVIPKMLQAANRHERDREFLAFRIDRGDGYVDLAAPGHRRSIEPNVPFGIREHSNIMLGNGSVRSVGRFRDAVVRQRVICAHDVAQAQPTDPGVTPEEDRNEIQEVLNALHEEAREQLSQRERRMRPGKLKPASRQSEPVERESECLASEETTGVCTK